MTPKPHRIECVAVDRAGIRIRADDDLPVDVLFDGRRICSFWSRRDTRRAGADRMFPWPPQLHRFLDGTTTLSLVDHVSGEEISVAELHLGTSPERIRIEDAQGNPMGLDKSQRLTRLFESRSHEQTRPLLDAMDLVLDGLEKSGVRPFIAYGTLLGAVRAGELIGHDSDADLGYVSSHDHPVDVIRESFRLQRALQRAGFQITRYSGLAFKVIVRESDGSPRGLDVFGGFLRAGHLYLMGEVGHPFRPEWLEPRQQVTLEGRQFPAPARPDRLLEAMYGPGWRVPDPAYKFETPVPTQRRLNGWFRGTRVGLESRWARYKQDADREPSGPSAFATWVRDCEPDMATAVDLGCGTGGDALWLGRQGIETWGLDYFPRSFRKAARRAARRELPVVFRWVNLSELRSILVTGAELARRPGPRVVMARHLADSTDAHGRDHLLRLARMVVRDSGRLYVQVQTSATAASRKMGVTPLDVDAFTEQVRASRGIVLGRVDLDESADPGGGSSSPSTQPSICRLVITWNR